MKPAGGIESLHPHDVQRLEQILRAFLAETNAHTVVLLDRTGQLLSTAGNIGDFDGTTFATLAAAGFAASDQLALLLGEEEFASLYHQGEKRSMYLADVGGRAILAALFDGRTTLGMIRLKAKAAVPQFSAVLADITARVEDRGAETDLGTGWLGEAEDEIDRLFGSR